MKYVKQAPKNLRAHLFHAVQERITDIPAHAIVDNKPPG
jgi:hypothetical protein